MHALCWEVLRDLGAPTHGPPPLGVYGEREHTLKLEKEERRKKKPSVREWLSTWVLKLQTVRFKFQLLWGTLGEVSESLLSFSAIIYLTAIIRILAFASDAKPPLGCAGPQKHFFESPVYINNLSLAKSAAQYHSGGPTSHHPAKQIPLWAVASIYSLGYPSRAGVGPVALG